MNTSTHLIDDHGSLHLIPSNGLGSRASSRTAVSSIIPERISSRPPSPLRVCPWIRAEELQLFMPVYLYVRRCRGLPAPLSMLYIASTSLWRSAGKHVSILLSDGTLIVPIMEGCTYFARADREERSLSDGCLPLTRSVSRWIRLLLKF